MTAKQEHVVVLQVKLEFGHKASCRKRPTPEGFTHDWRVFVRGQDDKDISQFVDKVVFHLHESFQKPKRVFKEPPYIVEEHGYGSFILPIDVYFKNKEEPKKVRIEYDLFLPALGMPSIDNIRSEALKFMNPPEEFKRKVLKAGGEIVDAINGTNGSVLTSNHGTVNGNAAHHSSNVNNGKEMKKEIKEERNNAVSEPEKVKKPKPEKQVPKPEKQVPKPEKQVPKPEKQVPKPEKQVPKPEKQVPKPEKQVPKPEKQVPKPEKQVPKPEKQVPKLDKQVPKLEKQVPKLEKQVPKPEKQVPKPEKQVPKLEKQVLKTANKVTNQTTGPTPCKRPSDDNEVLPKVKKKKKKTEDLPSPTNPKPTGFIPIEPLPVGVEEHHGIGDNKDIKLKIKSFPSKQSKKQTDKPTEKINEKKKEKKKDNVDTTTSTAANTSLVPSNDKNPKKTTTTSSSKTKDKSSKSPVELKKIPKKEDRKIEKLTFRRASGDSWSSTSSNSPGMYGSVLGNSSSSKSNPLGALMAELSDQCDEDDDDEDVDISTPFQTDALTSKTGSVPLSNNNTLHKKDNKPEKTKTKLPTKKDSKTSSLSSKNGAVKSPTNLLKTVESSKPSNKISSKTKSKETKNGKNGHQIPAGDLVHLHKELSSLKDSSSLQQVVDILEQSGCFVITDTNLEFDLYKLDMPTIRQIQKCVKR